MLIDSHAHLDMLIEADGLNEKELLASMKREGIGLAVQISTDADGLCVSRDLALRNAEQGLLFTAGIHPSAPLDTASLEAMESFVLGLNGEEKNLLLGIGECGLDYHYEGFNREEQIKAFERQAAFAKKMHLPLIVHTRDAWEDTRAVIRESGCSFGIIHCFSGDANSARQAFDMGFCISFAGNLTYKKSYNLHEAVRYAPLDSVLLETDAPFLSPVPYRGKPNRPEYISETYRFFAELKNIDRQNAEEAVYQNILALIGKRFK